MICTQFLHTFVLFRYMETVNFEKKRQFCVHFVSPIKTKSVPERDAFCFATRILPQAFFVQAVCYKCFSYKNFATSVFRTSFLLQVFLQAKVLLQVWLYNCLHTRVLQSTKQAQNCFCNVGVFTHGKFYLLQGAHFEF